MQIVLFINLEAIGHFIKIIVKAGIQKVQRQEACIVRGYYQQTSFLNEDEESAQRVQSETNLKKGRQT